MKKFFQKLIESDSKESSKRALAIWFSVVLTLVIFYLVIFTKGNGMLIVYALIGLILSLLSLAVSQGMHKTYTDNKTKRAIEQKKNTDGTD